VNPRDFNLPGYGHYSGSLADKPAAKSQFDIDLENAEQYFGYEFPGNEGLTCQKCGAAVNLGWQHIKWHEESK